MSVTPSTAPVQMGLSLGSNLGDRILHLRRAAALVLDVPGTTLIGKSTLLETEPVDVQQAFQHLKFINAVMIIETTTPAHEWLKTIAGVETALGRRRDSADKNSPRPVDVDIIFYGDELIGSGGLVVPHPRWAERRFVVQPLAELQPERTLPGMTKTVAEILQTLPGENECRAVDQPW